MYNEYKKGRCVISHIPYALKGQKLLAQGSDLVFANITQGAALG